MGNAKLTFLGLAVFLGFIAGCAWDNSPPSYHTVITYDPSRAKTYVSAVPSSNAPSTRDWKTNEDVGIDYGSAGYGSTGPSSAPTPSQAVGGAASTPSAVSSGAATGTTSPGYATPGTIVGNPPGAGLIGTSPSPAPLTTPSPVTTSPSITAPQPSTGLNNSGSGVTFTNRFTAPTNTLLNPGFHTPVP